MAVRTFGFTSETYTDLISGDVATKAVMDANYDKGSGELVIEVSFDNGSNWSTFLDTAGGINYLNQRVDIPAGSQGNDIIIKCELVIEDTIADTDYKSEWLEGDMLDPATGLGIAGVEMDIYDVETGEKVGWLITDKNGHYALEVSPGSYTVVPHGAGQMPDQSQIVVGESNYTGKFGTSRYTNIKRGDEALILTSFQVDWVQYVIFDTFGDSSKRSSPDPYEFDALCRYGRLYKGNAWIDWFALGMDPPMALP